VATAISQFRNRILPYVPGCPVPVVDTKVVDAMRTFCVDTNVFTKTIGATRTLQDGFTYTLAFTLAQSGDYYHIDIDITDYSNLDGYDLIMPVLCLSNGVEKNLLRLDLDENFNDLDLIVPTNSKFFCIPSSTIIRIFPYESEDDADVELVLTLSMMPEDGSTTVDDKFFGDWRDAIIALASANLQSIPKRSWTDYDQARINYGLYTEKRSLVSQKRTSFSFRKTRSAGDWI
jgi:hypothetical protein